MRKKLSVVLTGLISLCLLGGCAQSAPVQEDSTALQDAVVIESTSGTEAENEEQTGSKKMDVVTTIYAPYDFARQVAGDHATVEMLLPPGGESHSYDPTPQDIIKIQNCDVFVYVGGENDVWVDDVLASMEPYDFQVIKLLDCVNAVEEELKEGMEPEEEEEVSEDVSEEEEIEYDEHVWTSPKNAMLISEKMAKVFAEVDEANAVSYQDNLETYTAQLQELDTAFRDVVDHAARKTVVFGDRFPLRYFVEEYGLDYYAAFPGCASDTEASAATVAFLIDKVKEEQIPVVFQIELSSGNIAKAISAETGAKVETFYSCHNVSKDDFEAGVTYVEMMQKNVETLKEALN